MRKTGRRTTGARASRIRMDGAESAIPLRAFQPSLLPLALRPRGGSSTGTSGGAVASCCLFPAAILGGWARAGTRQARPAGRCMVPTPTPGPPLGLSVPGPRYAGSLLLVGLGRVWITEVAQRASWEPRIDPSNMAVASAPRPHVGGSKERAHRFPWRRSPPPDLHRCRRLDRSLVGGQRIGS